MSNRVTIHRLSIVVAFSIGIITLALDVASVTAALQGRGLSAPQDWQRNAELTDVFFLDALHGWAVGAQGVTLRTIDGGKNWLASEDEVEKIPETHQNLSDKIRDAIELRQPNQQQVLSSSFSQQPKHRLESVWFVDADNGWAAGGYDLPYVNRSYGVILRTTNGGKSWRKVENLVVPRIKQIRFADRRNGWAVGETSNMSPNGIFFTSDGGMTWSSQPSKPTPGWSVVARTQGHFVAIDTQGRPARVAAELYEPAVITLSQAPVLADVQMKDSQHGWSVGTDGAVLKTDNGGLSWSMQDAFSEQSSLVASFDFASLEITEEKIWFAGNPGHKIFSMNHDGSGLRAHVTDSTTPIRKIFFRDLQHGWAVGAMGTILATSDGGENWITQRSFPPGVAMLTLNRSVKDLPLEMIARYGAEDNLVCASAILKDNDSELDPASGDLSMDAVVQSLERAGCSLVLSIESATDLDAQTRKQVWLRKLVRTIRLLKPKSIVCGSAVSEDGFNEEAFVDQAIRMAADRLAFQEQISELGLTAHQVERIGVVDPNGDMGFGGHRLLPRMGLLLEDQLAISRTLLNQPVHRSNKFKYRVTRYLGRGKSLMRNPVAGELLAKIAGLSRRADDNSVRVGMAEIRRASSKKNFFAQLLKWQVDTPQQMIAWREALYGVTRDLESGIGGVWLVQIAESYLDVGQPELAALSLRQLVHHSPDHEFAPMAMTWLAQYYSSSEFNQLQFQKSLKFQTAYQATQIPSQADGAKVMAYKSKVEQMTVEPGKQVYRWSEVELPAIDAKTLKPVDDPDKMDLSLDVDDSVQPASTESAEVKPLSKSQVDEFFRNRLKLATQYFSMLGGNDPDIVLGPEYKYLQAHIIRQFAGAMESERYFKSLVSTDAATKNLNAKSENAMSASTLALRELKLSRQETENAETNLGNPESLVAVRSHVRPFLDGSFDDEVWREAVKDNQVIRKKFLHPDAMKQTNQDGATKDAVDAGIVAYDEEFLYLIFRCTKVDGREYPDSKQPRQRDADLSYRDRIEIELDIDRDGRTSTRFGMDYRGFVNESCGSCSGWNPNWFVAQQQDESSWTIECAISLKDLVPGMDPDRSPISINDANGAMESVVESHWTIRMRRNIADDRDWWATSNKIDSASRPRGLMQGVTIDHRPSSLLRFK